MGQRGDGGFERRGVVHGHRDRLHTQRSRGGFERAKVILGIGSRCWVEQEGDPLESRRNLLEQLHPLACHCGLSVDETGYVGARLAKLRHEAAADRIGNGYEDDGNGTRVLKERSGYRVVGKWTAVHPESSSNPT